MPWHRAYRLLCGPSLTRVFGRELPHKRRRHRRAQVPFCSRLASTPKQLCQRGLLPVPPSGVDEPTTKEPHGPAQRPTDVFCRRQVVRIESKFSFGRRPTGSFTADHQINGKLRIRHLKIVPESYCCCQWAAASDWFCCGQAAEVTTWPVSVTCVNDENKVSITSPKSCSDTSKSSEITKSGGWDHQKSVH